jgi:hypothetical protein
VRPINASGSSQRNVNGEKAMFAWEEALADWTDYGDREILTSYGFYS